MKTYRVSFYRPSDHSAWAYFKFLAKDSERAVARVNKELLRLRRINDSDVDWTLNRIEEVEKDGDKK